MAVHRWNTRMRSRAKPYRLAVCAKEGKPEHIREPVFGAYADPTEWLGRKFTKYEALLMAGPAPVYYSFAHIKIGEAHYRTATTDRNKRTVHSYFRTFFVNEEMDRDGNVIFNEKGEPKTDEIDR